MIFEATCVTDFCDSKYTVFYNTHGISGYTINKLKDFQKKHNKFNINKIIYLRAGEYDGKAVIAIKYVRPDGYGEAINLEDGDIPDKEIHDFLYKLFLN